MDNPWPTIILAVMTIALFGWVVFRSPSPDELVNLQERSEFCEAELAGTREAKSKTDRTLAYVRAQRDRVAAQLDQWQDWYVTAHEDRMRLTALAGSNANEIRGLKAQLAVSPPAIKAEPVKVERKQKAKPRRAHARGQRGKRDGKATTRIVYDWSWLFR